jgi:hypothetical protein
MLVLDENLPAGQRQLLRDWRIRFRVIGIDLASRGTKDDNLIPTLHKLPQPTFFTLDRDFFCSDWAHGGYGLVWLDVADDHAAGYIRRFLHHRTFDTQAKRMGAVVRVHADGIMCWRLGRSAPESLPWPTE